MEHVVTDYDVPDDGTDATAPFTAMLSSLPDGSTVVFDGGIYGFATPDAGVAITGHHNFGFMGRNDPVIRRLNRSGDVARRNKVWSLTHDTAIEIGHMRFDLNGTRRVGAAVTFGAGCVGGYMHDIEFMDSDPAGDTGYDHYAWLVNGGAQDINIVRFTADRLTTEFGDCYGCSASGVVTRPEKVGMWVAVVAPGGVCEDLTIDLVVVDPVKHGFSLADHSGNGVYRRIAVGAEVRCDTRLPTGYPFRWGIFRPDFGGSWEDNRADVKLAMNPALGPRPNPDVMVKTPDSRFSVTYGGAG